MDGKILTGFWIRPVQIDEDCLENLMVTQAEVTVDWDGGVHKSKQVFVVRL